MLREVCRRASRWWDSESGEGPSAYVLSQSVITVVETIQLRARNFKLGPQLNELSTNMYIAATFVRPVIHSLYCLQL